MELFTLGEILLIIAVFIVFFAAMYLKKFLSPKSQLIVSVACWFLLAGMFTYGLISNFNYTQLIITVVFLVLFAIGLFKRAKALTTNQ